MTEHKLVYVEWADSRGATASWQHLETLKENGICVVRSVGWLIQDEDDFIQIVPHIGTDPDQGCGDMTIPYTQVRRMVEMKIPETAAAKVLHDPSRSKKTLTAAGLSITQRRDADDRTL